MTDTQDQELLAMSSIINSLTPLDDQARQRVFEYVNKRFSMPAQAVPFSTQPNTTEAQLSLNATGTALIPMEQSRGVDIRSLKEDKQPNSANQMAAIVAYYLSELSSQKKDSITVADIQMYFKQAGFPLPKKPSDTLVNAKNAGYLEPGSEQATYKLSPVGYNLVAYGLPKGNGNKKRLKKKPVAAKKTSKGKK